VRSGGFQGAVSVDIATAGGIAVAGVNYTPINQVLMFAAGQDSQNFTITVKDDAVVTPDLAVNIVLSSPSTGTILGSPSTATLVIHDVDRSSTSSPLVTVDGVRLVTNKKHLVNEILVGFSGSVNSTEAQSTSIYRLTTAGKHGSFRARNARAIKLRSAVYQPTSDTVALVLRKPPSLSKPVQLVVDGVGPVGLHDSAGRLLDGNHDGQPGGSAVAVIRRGGVKISARSVQSSVPNADSLAQS
jgi:hypothetical protein